MAGFEGEHMLAKGAAFNAARPHPVIAGGAQVAYWELGVEVPGRGVIKVENKMTPDLWDLSLKVVKGKVSEVNNQMNLDNLTVDTHIIDDLGLKSIHRQDLMVRLKQNWRGAGHKIVPPTGLVRTIRTLGHIIEVVNLTEAGDEQLANQYRENRMKEIARTEKDFKASFYPEVEFA